MDRVRQLTWLDYSALVVLLVFVLSLMLAQGPHDTIVRTEAIQTEFPSAQMLLDGSDPLGTDIVSRRYVGYPLLLAGTTRLAGGNMFTAAKLLSSVCAVLFGLFAYLLIRQVFDSRVALLSALLSMSMGGVMFVACATGPEMLFALLAVAFLYCIARDPWPGSTQPAIAGLLAGLAYAVRPIGMLLLLMLALRLALIAHPGLSWRRRAKALGIAVLTSVVVSVVILVVGGSLFSGAIGLQSNSATLSDTMSGSAGESLQQWARELGQSLDRLFVGLPEIVRVLGRYPENESWFLSTPLWVLAMVGIPLAIWGYDRRKIWFTLSLGLAWVAAAIALADPPSYVVLVPALAALAVLLFTSRLLPDALLTRQADKLVVADTGLLVDRMRRRRGRADDSAVPSGVSLTLVLLIGLLTISALVAAVRTRQVFAQHRADDSYYHDIAEVIEATLGPGTHYPVGASSQSQARYWLPVGSRTPVAVVDFKEDFYSAIPELSYVLFDGSVDSPDSNSPAGDLSNPVAAKPYLEAVFYQPEAPTVILYRMLDNAREASVVDISASSSGSETAPTYCYDGLTSTWWTSEPQTSRDSAQSLTVDLGQSQIINRVWILPKLRGEGFPVALGVSISTDGQVWQQTAKSTDIALPERQDPLSLTFEPVAARFVRVSANQSRWDDELQGYAVSLAEIRVGFGRERPAQLAQFSTSGDGSIGFDAVTHELVAVVRNEGDVSGRASAEFFKGWSAEEAEYLGKVISSEIAPGAEGEVRLFFDGGDTLRPDHCRPVRLVLQAFGQGPSGLVLDTYGTEVPEEYETSAVVCSPEIVALDDFDYADSPLTRGWSASSASITPPSVAVSDDPELGRRVMRIDAANGDTTVVGLWVKIYDRPHLSFQARSEETFTILLGIVTLGDERFYVQYSPDTWDTSSEEYPTGKVVSFGLGKHVADGEWGKVSLDIAEGFWTRTGLQIDYLELFGVRTEGSLEIADITLGTSR